MWLFEVVLHDLPSFMAQMGTKETKLFFVSQFADHKTSIHVTRSRSNANTEIYPNLLIKRVYEV